MITNNKRKSQYQDLNHFNFQSIPLSSLDLPSSTFSSNLEINILSLEIS